MWENKDRVWWELLASGKLKISKTWKAYTTTGQDVAARELNEKIENVRNGIDEITNPKITKRFMEMFDYNRNLMEHNQVTGIVDYNSRMAIKPKELIDECLAFVEKQKKEDKPITMAGLCHHLCIDRKKLWEILSKKGYDGAKTAVHNILLKYAEESLFSGKNVSWAMFYLKNAFPEFYKERSEVETKVKISLVQLSKRADSIEWKLKKANVIEGEVVEEDKDRFN